MQHLLTDGMLLPVPGIVPRQARRLAGAGAFSSRLPNRPVSPKKPLTATAKVLLQSGAIISECVRCLHQRVAAAKETPRYDHSASSRRCFRRDTLPHPAPDDGL